MTVTESIIRDKHLMTSTQWKYLSASSRYKVSDRYIRNVKKFSSLFEEKFL